MFRNSCYSIAVLLFIFSGSLRAQETTLAGFIPDPVKVEKYYPYMVARHGSAQAVDALKVSDRFLYFRELWYYTESFSIVRNYSSQGTALNEEIIDISRFEAQRKYDEAVIVTLPGFRDALKLLPGKDLLYKPGSIR
jgi:hypothetical protein